jgi:quercetin dioxygenase-like cupin family protein
MDLLEQTQPNARISVRMVEQSQTITKKSTGSIRLLTFAKDEDIAEEVSPLDTFIQILEGSAEVIIEGISHFLKTGQILILPAKKSNKIKANTGVKLISTSII